MKSLGRLHFFNNSHSKHMYMYNTAEGSNALLWSRNVRRSSVRPSVCPLLTFHIFSTSSLKPLNGIQQNFTRSKISTSSPKCVLSRRSEKQDGCPGLWLAGTFSTSSLKPLNGIQRNLTGSKISTSSTKFVFFRLMSKQKLPPLLICQKKWHIDSGARYVALWASCYRPMADANLKHCCPHFTDIPCPWGLGRGPRTYRILPYFNFVAAGGICDSQK